MFLFHLLTFAPDIAYDPARVKLFAVISGWSCLNVVISGINVVISLSTEDYENLSYV